MRGPSPMEVGTWELYSKLSLPNELPIWPPTLSSAGVQAADIGFNGVSAPAFS